MNALYDRGLFMQAYRETAAYWKGSKRLEEFSIEELILGIRLAERLGGGRVSRWIAREAFRREPTHPKVRYFTVRLRVRGQGYFDYIRSIQEAPELAGADPVTQSSWLAFSALHWAYLRDFDSAHKCIKRAHEWSPSDDWVLSCESDVLAFQDRWEESYKAAEAGWKRKPGTNYGARSLGASLLHLGRVEEAAQQLAAAARTGESYEIAHLACWYLAALAETRSGEQRARVLVDVNEMAERATALAPLADRDTRASFALTRLDIAELADDHAAMEHWAREARSPFHRKVLENLRSNPNGLRIRVPFRRAIQKHDACLPTSIGSAMAAMGTPINADAMASELTFGGTPEWAAGEWLERQGYDVRFFVARPDIAIALVKNGFAFVMTLESDTSAHAVAIVGVDEAAGTLIVHDPNGYRSTEYLLSALGKDEAPLGPRAMVAARPERGVLLDSLLPRADVQTMSAREAHRRIEFHQGSAEARNVVAEIAQQYPAHPNTRLLQALQDHTDGRLGAALEQFQNLLKEFPGSAFVRSSLLACCRSSRNTALMRNALANVLERGILPGIQSEQRWRYPPPDFVSEYADLLRLSGTTSQRAKSMLMSVIARGGTCASAWHSLADLLWGERDLEGALLGYRIASSLVDRNEHYARAYAGALARAGRREEGYAWLQQRVRRFGAALQGPATWISLIAELEAAGYPERALAAADEALRAQGGSPELLAELVRFQARMGNWPQAQELLSRLEQAESAALFHEASAHFFEMRGELDHALAHARKWLTAAPLSMPAREQIVNLVALRDGTKSAIACAREWLVERPAHEEIEGLYCRQLNRSTYTSLRKYAVLLRRVKRNPEDSWSWAELAFCAMYDFEMAGAKRQRRLESRIIHYLGECERTSPGDAVTIRAQAQWLESRGEWNSAVARWLEAIERDPASLYAYQHLWDCSARISHEERLDVWARVQSALLREPGHSTIARELALLAAQRFGVSVAEAAVTRWMEIRPEDPEIVEAYADLLMAHGHGRTDHERALELLLPELERFPFHLGLRLSHADALKHLGRFGEAEEAYREIVRRHPDNSWARVQLAWMKHRRGDHEGALEELKAAATRSPQNTSIYHAKAEMLIQAQRFGEARAVIVSTTQQFPRDVSWRKSALKLLSECGDLDNAVAVVRQAVVEYPRGAYLWNLLGRTLAEHRQFAGAGEVESCLRRSLALNHGLYEAADYLAIVLAEQKRYTEAADAITDLEKRNGDPSGPLGRLAWLRRRKGEKRQAREEMGLLVGRFPWYAWGWSVLFDWFVEDKAWDDARRVLAVVAPEQRTNVGWRQRRLELLASAGIKAGVLDQEWNSLLQDFPEEMPLHLIRYDSLREEKRWSEATAVLTHIREFHPDSPFLLARWIEGLVREGNKAEAIATLFRLFFAESEPSVWPADHAWEALKEAGWGKEAYHLALAELEKRRQPTRRAIWILASFAIECFPAEKKQVQPFFRTWFPHRCAKEILRLLTLLDAINGRLGMHHATLFRKLSDLGYPRLVFLYWKKHRGQVATDTESWSETTRAFAILKKRREAREVFSGWQERKGVEMWVVANYLTCLRSLGSRHLTEIRSTCHAALAGLPHDHCARYIAHREAEAGALVRDQNGFAQCYAQYQLYFDGAIDKKEWFPARERHLLADIPALARHLRDQQYRAYKAKVRSLRWERFKLEIPSLRIRVSGYVRWWWLILLLWILLRILSDSK